VNPRREAFDPVDDVAATNRLEAVERVLRPWQLDIDDASSGHRAERLDEMPRVLDEEERIVVAVHDEERPRIGPHMKQRRSLFPYAPVLPGRALDDLVDKVRSAIEPATPPFSVAVAKSWV
jgi:hypothetical protein